MSKTRSIKVKALISQLQKLPPQSTIAIEVWNRKTDEWENAKPNVCEDSKGMSRFVISYDPVEIEGKNA